MKVFISWSGPRSQALAQALRDWLPLVLHYVEPWLSESDIAAGERWAQSVAKQLETSNFGIICVTRENVGAPWILFEAGSLAKSLEGSRVIPLLLDLDFAEISGPLAQFQAKKADKDGVAEVVSGVNRAADQPDTEERIQQLFDALWPKLEAQISAIPKHAGASKPIRPQHEVLEELVASVRAVDSRVRSVEERFAEGGPALNRRRRRFPPHLLHELPHVIGLRPGDPLGILILAGLLRDDAPWLYELGLEAYRAAKAGRREQARAALTRFRHATEFTLHGPIAFDDSGFDPRMLHVIERELDHFMYEMDESQELPPSEVSSAKSRRKKKTSET
jgi:hypothetical protein